MSKSKIQEKSQRLDAVQREAVGRCRLIYGEDGEFEVYAVCQGDENHHAWSMRLMYPTAGIWRNGVKKKAQWTGELLIDAMQSTLRKIRQAYRGSWFLDVRKTVTLSAPMDRQPGAAAQIRQTILNGPDGPGRRFLEKQRATPVPRGVVAKVASSLAVTDDPAAPRTPSREDLDKISKPSDDILSRPIVRYPEFDGFMEADK